MTAESLVVFLQSVGVTAQEATDSIVRVVQAMPQEALDELEAEMRRRGLAPMCSRKVDE